MNIDLEDAKQRCLLLEGAARARGYDGEVSARIWIKPERPFLYFTATDKKINDAKPYGRVVPDNDLGVVVFLDEVASIAEAVDKAVAELHAAPSRKQRELNVLAARCQLAIGSDLEYSAEIRDTVIAALRQAFTDAGLAMITHQPAPLDMPF